MANCETSGVVEVRCADIEKLSVLPVPIAKPKITNETTTRILINVSTFWIFATRLTPKQFKRVNRMISAEASICAPPIFSAHVPEPSVYCALACFRAGKK